MVTSANHFVLDSSGQSPTESQSPELSPDTLFLWVSVQLCPDRHSCELLSKVVLIAHYLDCEPTIIDLIT